MNKGTKTTIAITVTVALGLMATPAHAADAPTFPLRIDRIDPTANANPADAVIVIHGGGWSSGTPDRDGPVCDAIVTVLNLTCFAPDYTLSGVAPFPAANNDLVLAVQYVRDLGFTRVAVVGMSAGGNLAAWLAMRGLVDVAIVWSAPADLTVPAATWTSRSLRRSVAAFAPTRESRRAASPALGTIAVPLLVVTSNHELIPLPQARELYGAATGPRHLTIFRSHKHAAQYTARELPETLAWLGLYL